MVGYDPPAMSSVSLGFTRQSGCGEDEEDQPGWGQFAACQGKPVEWFYPRRGKAAEAEQIAATICRTCPVQYVCLQQGMLEEHGMWGAWAAELRWWVRVRSKPCAWCGTEIGVRQARMFCDDECVAEAVIATGEAAYRVRAHLDDLLQQARLGIAQQRKRRLDEPAPQPMAVAGG